MGLFQNVGEIVSGTKGLFTEELGGQFEIMRAHYIDPKTDDTKAFVDKVGGAPGTYSLFNPFRIFRYSGFGTTTGDYNYDLHLDSQGTPPNPGGGIGGLLNAGLSGFAEDAPDEIAATSSLLKSFTEVKKSMENPTASDIIRWAQKGEAQSPVPYAPQDFLWCKYYGKVPNNRMLTLRRYAMPVEDDIFINEDKGPAVPIAQAVSWYGSDIDNPLKNILNLSWGLKWADREAEVKDIAGNEISVEEIAKATGLTGADNQKLINILKSQVFANGSSQDILKLAGYDEKIQDYIRTAYDGDGPYWNRILGPVNVINKTKIRERGFEDQPDIVLNFEYSLRSYGGINPKIAFLDLLGNMLSLTYNTAPFWGGGYRYFQTTGITVPGLQINDYMARGDVAGGIAAGLEAMANQANANLDELIDFAKSIAGGKYGSLDDLQTGTSGALQGDKSALDERLKQGNKAAYAKAGPVSKLLASRVGALMQKPLVYRALLDGRAVGEWHLTIGNPMNPMAMIGNLCLKSVKMELGETLGIDDFPTEFKFQVTLSHGRPRAKQDIESMFNLGKGAMTYSQLAQPSSASNSYGDANTRRQNAWNEGINPESPEAINPAAYAQQRDAGNSKVGDDTSYTFRGEGEGATLESIVSRYGRQVGNMYGGVYANSPILTDYFKELKTKD